MDMTGYVFYVRTVFPIYGVIPNAVEDVSVNMVAAPIDSVSPDIAKNTAKVASGFRVDPIAANITNNVGFSAAIASVYVHITSLKKEFSKGSNEILLRISLSFSWQITAFRTPHSFTYIVYCFITIITSQ